MMTRLPGKACIFILFFAVVLPLTAVGEMERRAYPTSVMTLIDQAYQAGDLSEGDRAFLTIQALRDPGALPADYQPINPTPMKSGTPYILQALKNWDAMSPEQQAQAVVMMERAPLDSVYISPGNHFRIRYGFTNPDSVPADDFDSSGIPDYVERTALYADSAYHVYQEIYGYLPPPLKNDSLYTINLKKLLHVYGQTLPTIPGDSSWDDYVSYIDIDCNMANVLPNDDPEGDPIGALKVTVVHEYFHATQCAYDTFEDDWWMECTAVFHEELLFPEVNDNYNFLPYFYDYPDTSLLIDSYHAYGAFVWPMYLVDLYGYDVIKSAFEYARYFSIIPSLDSALAGHDETVRSVFSEFTVWNYFTGARAETTSYYVDAADYPMSPLDQTAGSCPFMGLTPVKTPDGMGCNYIVAYPDSSENGGLKLNFDGANSAVWGFSYVAFADDDVLVVADCDVDLYGRTKVAIYDYLRYDSLVFIPAVISPFQYNHTYVFDMAILPFGDADGSGEINLLDILLLIGNLYSGGLPPAYDYYMGDADGSGRINLLDILYLIDYVYQDGPAPVVYRP
ncbi:MAG: hypothetical protein JW763_04495 [candidate division Zixibacteria bacterium]|nr:hypothetical protein [candidate division Zixibacteria bacterium]